MITKSLKILLWDNEIGRLTWDDRRSISYFEYNRDFLNGNLDTFPIVASIKSPASKRPIMGDRETKIFRKLPPFLADSLPDAWGNQVFECWRIENGIKTITPLDILSFIGKRGMGALEFIPESSGIKDSEQLNLKALTELAQRIFVEREKVNILPDESLTMQSLIAVGTSAGGRQPKAIIAINPETGEIRSGQIVGLEGFEYCILKFGDSERSSAELEMAYCEMALEAGIQMMTSRLIDVEGKKHFVTKRFDRNDDRKIHVQTLAAMYPESDSYEKLLWVCRKLRLPKSDIEEVFRRMVFNILANNTDDHYKNFSFLMDEEGKWSLAPAYDITYIFNPGGFLPDKMHCLMINGKTDNITLSDAMAVAGENAISKAENIIREVAGAVSRFRGFAEKYGVQEKWISTIETTLSSNLNDWGLGNSRRNYHTFEIDGIKFAGVHIEQTYKGNYHLYATIDGRESKYVIGPRKEEYALIESTGILNLSENQLYAMVEKFFMKEK